MTIAAGTSDTSADQEADLVARAKARDASVWGLWHDQYYALIFRYAAARLRDPDEAEDVVAQVFLEALKSIDRYRYQGKPILAWFYGIAHHLVSRQLRQRGKTTGIEHAADLGSEGFEEASVRSIAVQKALEQLKPEHREVLVLRFMLGLPTREVAQLMGRSETSTYSLQVRAALSLRKKMPGWSE